MGPVPLTPLDLALASVLVILVAASSYYGRLAISKPLLVGGVRTALQLILIGLVLEALFAFSRLHWVVLMAMVMLLFAGGEVMARQKRRFAGRWGFRLGTLAMFVSSFTVTVLALTAIIGPEPWYRPQYANAAEEEDTPEGVARPLRARTPEKHQTAMPRIGALRNLAMNG